VVVAVVVDGGGLGNVLSVAVYKWRWLYVSDVGSGVIKFRCPLEKFYDVLRSLANLGASVSRMSQGEK